MKTKSGFEVLKIVDIPESYLSKGILRELSGREIFVDTDEDLGEQIFSSDVFEQIAWEKEEGGCFFLTDADLKSVDALAEELGEYELVRITKVYQ
jgi:hypothetical protein